MTTVELLESGRKRIAAGWCQRAYTRKNRTEFCTLGAIRVGPKDCVRTPDALHFLREAAAIIYKTPWCEVSLVHINDLPTTTQADILALYDAAIELAKAKD